MTKWEYRVISFETFGLLGGLVETKEIEEKLNELGKEGWELISAYATVGGSSSRRVVYNFKRASQF